jgi:hypothetical protein
MIYQWEGCANNKIAPRQRRFYLKAPPLGTASHRRANPFSTLEIQGLTKYQNNVLILSFKIFCQLKGIRSMKIRNFGQ